MSFSSARLLLLAAFVAVVPALRAQGWDAATQAVGWARQDKDDSFTFYDPAARVLRTWMQDGGDIQDIPLDKLKEPPSKWVIDPRGDAWVVSGTTLTQVDSAGRLARDLKLPAPVDSVCWDTKGFVLSYRTQNPYLEMRRYQDGEVLWTYGRKPGRKDPITALSLHPMLMSDTDQVLLGNGNDLGLLVLDANTGKPVREEAFSFNGNPAPALVGAPVDRGPLCLWSGKGVVFATLRAGELPAVARGTIQGQALVRMDLKTATVTFAPTGLATDHLLVGILHGQAVFVNPKGGLLQLPVK